MSGTTDAMLSIYNIKAGAKRIQELIYNL